MNKVRGLKITVVINIILFGLCISKLVAQDVNKSHFNLNKSGVIIDGYDVVSYFTGEPAKGNPNVFEMYNGVIYRFVSEENRQIFMRSPGKFIPAYGGWCAYAMADSGEKVKIDPETYKIIGGRLYLFYNFYFNNTLITWNENEAVFIKNADQNWGRLISK